MKLLILLKMLRSRIFIGSMTLVSKLSLIRHIIASREALCLGLPIIYNNDQVLKILL